MRHEFPIDDLLRHPTQGPYGAAVLDSLIAVPAVYRLRGHEEASQLDAVAALPHHHHSHDQVVLTTGP